MIIINNEIYRCINIIYYFLKAIDSDPWHRISIKKHIKQMKSKGVIQRSFNCDNYIIDIRKFGEK